MSNDVLNSVSSEEAKRIINSLLLREHASNALNYAGYGVATGGLLGGLSMLAKTLSRQSMPPKSTFTTPVMTTVYVPESADKKAKKAELSPVAVMANNDKWSYAAKLLGMMAGIPIGAMAVNSVGTALKNRSQRKHLESLYNEFETSLQDYARSKEEPVAGRKIASSPEQEKMHQLTSNICKIAESPSLMARLNQLLVAYAVGTPIVAGAIGFSNQWDKRRGKDLQAAELSLQAQREKTNPTYPVTSITELPAGDGKRASDARERLAAQNLNAVDTDYLN